MNISFEIKGSCENCGFAYMGTIPADNGSFPVVFCPHCKEETQNFDEAHAMDGSDNEEGTEFEYVLSTFVTKPNETE